MECNRDEAVRAKEIAEKKFLANDIAGAKKFALKAQNLFPSLDGISQMIATLDVYLSSNARSDGEKDWYGILSVDPSADDETVKKQYRKLALQLHPDKNKSIGAEGAFQIISEAWSVLSDGSKRMVHHHKSFGKSFQQKTTTVQKEHHAPNTANGFGTKSNNTHAPKVHGQKSNTWTAPKSCDGQKINTGTAPKPCNSKPPSSQPSKPQTFWTSCNQCNTYYEYLRVYLNFHLLCPNCRQAFVASEYVVPIKGSNHSAPSQQLHQNTNFQSTTKSGHVTSTVRNVGSSGVPDGVGPNVNHSSNFQRDPFSRTSGAASVYASSASAAQPANVVHYTSHEKVRRDRDEAQEASRREEALPKSGLKRNSFVLETPNPGFGGNECNKNAKRRRGIIDDPKMNYGRETGKADMHTAGHSNSPVNSRQFNLRRGFPQAHVLGALRAKSKEEIHKKVESWISERATQSAKENSRKKQKAKEIVKEKIKEANPGIAADQHRVDELNNNSKQAPLEIDLDNTKDADSDNKMTDHVNIDVPDADFHDFDKDRNEQSFKCDEIWATYDDEDGMPRFYVLVQKVISYKPFKVRMSFLTSKSNSEFGPLNWVSTGFAKTSGEFRVGRYDVNDTINVFSHKVKWEKGIRGVIKIVPKLGEVWALYRNWSPDWDEHTPDDVMYKYDMVEVLEDYNDEQGVAVAPLLKVAGFKTVFHRHLDPNKAKRIPREEMFRFSHQVPSFVLTGEEGPNAPKGCYELDPAGTPLELLQVITESKDDMVIQASDLHQRTND